MESGSALTETRGQAPARASEAELSTPIVRRGTGSTATFFTKVRPFPPCYIVQCTCCVPATHYGAHPVSQLTAILFPYAQDRLCSQ